MSFAESRLKFQQRYLNEETLRKSLVTVDGKWLENISLIRSNGEKNEEYYKWEFIYSIINSELYSRDYIGTEIYFPKGNIGSAPIKIDAVIFNDVTWISEYKKYRENKDQDALDKLRKMAIVMIEFKDDDNKKIEQVFNSQIKATIKESDSNFCLGVYYNEGRLYLFKKINGIISRYDNSKNFPKSQRILEQYQLELNDPYYIIPDFHELDKKINGVDISKADLTVNDLDIIDKISDENLRNSLNAILRQLTEDSLFNEEGYMLLIQLLACKIYDEHKSEQYGSPMNFHITDEEIMLNGNLSNPIVQKFVQRLSSLFNEARQTYTSILSEHRIDWKNVRQVRVAQTIVKEFQRFAFTRSERGDLYQLVFYNFATKFKKEENAQFLTPIPIINFIVDIVNPKKYETVCDPCCGISDFLSVSYVNSEFKLRDNNLYGIDNDYNMTVLAKLNMLLNGDGNANIYYAPNKGSIDHKLGTDKELKTLDSNYHLSGNWDNWVDGTELMKYDVILTNPPFGKGRNLDLSNAEDLRVSQFYETYDRYVETNPKDGLDLGVVFLENAVRSIRDGGRFAIVLSNSIASNKSFEFARKWLMEQVRIVALFDLPSNIFAETGVNTTIIVGYKPSAGKDRLDNLITEDYEVFVREVKKVGYTKKTVKRNVIFDNDFKLNSETFETVIDDITGENVLNEDFTQISEEFKEWCAFQEDELKKKFLD
ncbi:HsdM family class I SAM-dependent methyltransferase [Clostridium botulinum]|uniref:SAM-dependent DNA methyltransferase n=1 Tax=Clostridium botulinum TaxID=1491 RepID=A0A6G4EG67_CLOBO|nr:N-6 DNA methylase [Clostridium botulinum]APH18327.1 methyltransferase small domain protein [Clostridium botulinum]AUM91705.1 N-6 DNA methylase [Clostridium botulinum]NFB13116.1 SAM-dependent DNA methyltransferase [Clostridium botulinum]NFH57348.1 SAM-dependent DNA methyltransferase [Clostridium botulinum]NFH62237.1 SAM-dependent DNA methyltransferase [Clostridium botulinum]